MAISQYPASSGSSGTSNAKKYLNTYKSNNSGSAMFSSSNKTISKKIIDSNYSYAPTAYATGMARPLISDFADKNFFAVNEGTWRPLGDLSTEAFLGQYSTSIIQYPTASFARSGNHNQNCMAASDLNTAYRFIAIGSSARLYSSADASTWTDRGYIQAANYQTMLTATYANGIFVAGGYNGTIITSTDGSSWSLASSGITGKITNIYYENEKFWIISGGKIASSSNGTTWTTVSTPNINPYDYDNYTDFAYGAGTYFVSDRGTSKLFKSTDEGATWVEVTSGPFYPGSYNTKVDGIAYGNGKFVAVCKDGYKTYISTDGTNWETVSSPFGYISGEVTGLQFIDGKFIMLGTLSVVQSTNGKDWKYFGLYVQAPFKNIQKSGDVYYQNAYYDVYMTTELSKIAENFTIDVYEAQRSF